ncbi:sensor histidine kinase [Tenacibaculum sp. IB213877]|uniref:sensor histidine kinase n=1 Tax=Tenacibaculum sp. IB213877 TaxID=3097351 RepID=UPI002A5A3150|nr:ATP-binding protein [Tenacibaculum sp. IB213877]MDY0780118.1 ATP-binding protein [Tenacibaculum sp. IB213877]
MPNKNIIESNKVYVILSAVVLGILLSTFIGSYMFFSQLEDSLDSSNEEYDEYIQLNQLSEKYKLIEKEQLQSSLLKRKIDSQRWHDLSDDIELMLQNLRSKFKDDQVQLTKINAITFQQDKLFGTLSELDTTFALSSRRNILKKFKDINTTLVTIDSIKNSIVKHKRKNISKILKDQDDTNRSVAIMMVITSLLALVIFTLSVYKLFVDKKKYLKTALFLERILDASNDIVNLYTPIYNNDKVVDFKIEYASKANQPLTHFNINNIKGKRVTEVFPFLKPSGSFDQILQSFNSQTSIERVNDHIINGESHKYFVRLFPSENNMKIIISDVTKTFEDEKELIKLNENLKLNNDILNEAEKLASMGSYIWFIDEDNSVLSDNVYRILGYKPQEFKSSAEKFKEFIHSEDIDMYDQQIEEAYKNNKPIDFVFRVITPQNTVKYLYTNGELSNYYGKTTMIGVIQDITMKIDVEKELQEKNTELTHQNAELESFNRIASHDLQEPLRKVQMYLSRLSETEQLSDRSKKYIDRATKASARMRTLINNLLAFSRINKKETEFTSVNLNTILHEAIDDLSLSIEESQAEIIYNDLPEIKGVEFQLNQLFNNLLSNAIKYLDKEKKLQIKITSKKINYKQIDEPFVKNYTEYYQIKVTDNGIGFDNNMRNKIFEMFQRLHQKHEYSGTGIGLAICKKIVVNHHGFIKATSIKGSGSVFTIYFPAT